MNNSYRDKKPLEAQCGKMGQHVSSNMSLKEGGVFCCATGVRLTYGLIPTCA